MVKRKNLQGKRVFITGGTGYVGRRLVALLVERGYNVRALVRGGSEHKLPEGCEPVQGNALEPDSYTKHVHSADAMVHLVGVSHPHPFKAGQFRAVDLVSTEIAVSAALKAKVPHFVYVSVAQPAPIMKDYVQVRAECEALLRGSGLNATILRPWYVLGPGHRWPYAFVPFYWLFEKLPASRTAAQRLGFVTLEQLCLTLLRAIDHPASGIRILSVPEIRIISAGRFPRSEKTAA